jgi:hypothetical protein
MNWRNNIIMLFEKKYVMVQQICHEMQLIDIIFGVDCHCGIGISKIGLKFVL